AEAGIRDSSVTGVQTCALPIYEYRRDLLGKAPRHLGVLNLAASKAGWNSPLPAGRSRGIAVWKSFDSYVAEVAEISMQPDGTPQIGRAACRKRVETLVARRGFK